MAGPLSTRRADRNKTIGRLRHRVTIQKQADTPERDASGAEVEAWEDVLNANGNPVTVWADVVAVSGAEQMRNGQVQANTTYKVTMRHREDVTPKHRLIWVTSKPAGKVLNVVAVPPTVGAGNSLELVCVEELL